MSVVYISTRRGREPIRELAVPCFVGAAQREAPVLPAAVVRSAPPNLSKVGSTMKLLRQRQDATTILWAWLNICTIAKVAQVAQLQEEGEQRCRKATSKLQRMEEAASTLASVEAAAAILEQKAIGAWRLAVATTKGDEKDQSGVYTQRLEERPEAPPDRGVGLSKAARRLLETCLMRAEAEELRAMLQAWAGITLYGRCKDELERAKKNVLDLWQQRSTTTAKTTLVAIPRRFSPVRDSLAVTAARNVQHVHGNPSHTSGSPRDEERSNGSLTQSQRSNSYTRATVRQTAGSARLPVTQRTVVEPMATRATLPAVRKGDARNLQKDSWLAHPQRSTLHSAAAWPHQIIPTQPIATAHWLASPAAAVRPWSKTRTVEDAASEQQVSS
eukprot:TRINITY_DN7638_c0_g1_i1.p1 TRINITY_DN7638_c0_g1~~TRINITY_DN7638_c0_g1_i1.p1  ORF type:complete len:387 (+),score=55.40 TRINITY_DN7638_c0_g1_i1:94-1254(+)